MGSTWRSGERERKARVSLVAESPAESIPQKVILEFHCCSRLPWSPFRPNFFSGRPKARVDCSHLSSWAVTFSAPPHVEPGGYFF